MRITRLAGVALALGAMIGVGVIAPQAIAKKPKVSVQIATKDQAALLKAGGLSVKISSSGKATVSLKGASGGKGNLFKAKKVMFNKKGNKKVKLALTSAGRSTLSTCGSKTVEATASYRGGKKSAKKSLAPSETRCKATIRTTEYGVPRITANDYGSLGFGYGYSLAKENICSMADTYLTVKGERSRYFGPDALVPGELEDFTNLESDFLRKSIIEDGRVERLLEKSGKDRVKQEVRDTIEGYVLGYNRYLRTVGVDNLPDKSCAGEPWVKPITKMDAYRLFYRLLGLAGTNNMTKGIADARPPSSASRADSNVDESPDSTQSLDESLGLFADRREGPSSNAVGLGKDATTTGKGMLFGNPHFPWTGSLRLYQSQLTIPGKMNASGASLFGVPMVMIGHTGDLAWSHTVSTAIRFAVYRLKLKPNQPTVYVEDGREIRMKSQRVSVDVKQDDGSVTRETRTLYSTKHGPVFNEFAPVTSLDFQWTDEYAFAVKDPNLESLRAMNHFLEVNRAGSVTRLEEILDDIQGIPWVNTIAADSTGRAFYGDVGVVPNVTDSKADACIPSGFFRVLWNNPAARIPVMDGSRSSCNLERASGAAASGILPPSMLPRITRDDYASNMNDSFWLANPESPLVGYPWIIGTVDRARTFRTRLGLTQVADRLSGMDGKPGRLFDLEQVTEMLTDGNNYSAMLLKDSVIEFCADPELSPRLSEEERQACASLSNYGDTDRLDDPGAVLWRSIALKLPLTNSDMIYTGSLYRDRFLVNDPVNTPAGLNVGDQNVRTQVQEAIQDAVNELQDWGIPANASLRNYQFVEKNGERIPIPGGPGAIGSYNNIYNTNSEPDPETGVVNPNYGTSFVINASLDGSACPDVKTILSYSQAATNVDSDYFDDQTRLFSDYGWVEDRFCLDQQLADPSLRTEELNGGAP